MALFEVSMADISSVPLSMPDPFWFGPYYQWCFHDMTIMIEILRAKPLYLTTYTHHRHPCLVYPLKIVHTAGPENEGRNEQVLTEACLITYETSKNNNHISSLHCLCHLLHLKRQAVIHLNLVCFIKLLSRLLSRKLNSYTLFAHADIITNRSWIENHIFNIFSKTMER